MTLPASDDASARPPASDDQWQTASRISHDLSNVICAIRGYAEMLLEDVPADTRPPVDLLQIREAAERAADLVTALRELARRAGATPPPPAHD